MENDFPIIGSHRAGAAEEGLQSLAEKGSTVEDCRYYHSKMRFRIIWCDLVDFRVSLSDRMSSLYGSGIESGHSFQSPTGVHSHLDLVTIRGERAHDMVARLVGAVVVLIPRGGSLSLIMDSNMSGMGSSHRRGIDPGTRSLGSLNIDMIWIATSISACTGSLFGSWLGRDRRHEAGSRPLVT
jgi:hypothetical protein